MKQQVHGNVTGVRDTLIEALGQLYDYEVDEDTFLPHELMQDAFVMQKEFWFKRDSAWSL